MDAQRTPLWSLRPISAGRPPLAPPTGLFKGSAAAVRGHWHHLKGTPRKGRSGLVFQLSFQPSFILLARAMADTQVDSGSDISPKVSPTCPRRADPPLTRILLRAPPRLRASLRLFALRYRTGSLRGFGSGSAELAASREVEIRPPGTASGSGSGTGTAAAPPRIVRRDPSARLLCLSDGAVLLPDSRTQRPGPGPNTYTRAPTGAAWTLARASFYRLFRISCVRSRCLCARWPVSERTRCPTG